MKNQEVINPPTRNDIEILALPAIEEATKKLNKRQVANMILVGAFLERRPIVQMDNILKALKKVLPERHHHLIPLNEQALMIGKKFAQEAENITV